MNSHDGWMWFGGGYMWLVWVLIIAVLVILVKSITDSSSGSIQTRNDESPMSILKKRFARGEIDEEEFNRRKKELEHE
ncbi:MAG TPA: SHOCT domain-containing protein [Gammaproteobacteria bacterium]